MAIGAHLRQAFQVTVGAGMLVTAEFVSVRAEVIEYRAGPERCPPLGHFRGTTWRS